MAICVILAHPRKGSFNHAIAEAVIQTLEERKTWLQEVRNIVQRYFPGT